MGAAGGDGLRVGGRELLSSGERKELKRLRKENAELRRRESDPEGHISLFRVTVKLSVVLSGARRLAVQPDPRSCLSPCLAARCAPQLAAERDFTGAWSSLSSEACPPDRRFGDSMLRVPTKRCRAREAPRVRPGSPIRSTRYQSPRLLGVTRPPRCRSYRPGA